MFKCWGLGELILWCSSEHLWPGLQTADCLLRAAAGGPVVLLNAKP